jgi:hypothetical protein
VLPTRSSEYGGEFRAYPVETFQHERISVLTDDSGKAGRVYLETAEKKRVFGRVWIPEDAIIFKGPCILLFLFFFQTLYQISLERLRVKALSVRSSKTPLTYGVLRSLRRLTPPGHRFRLVL